MATRADFEKTNALIAEAVALCEAAQQEFERINEEVQKAIRQSRGLTSSLLLEQERRARQTLFEARKRLTRRLGRRRQLLQQCLKDG